jgi:hypothetical protein
VGIASLVALGLSAAASAQAPPAGQPTAIDVLFALKDPVATNHLHTATQASAFERRLSSELAAGLKAAARGMWDFRPAPSATAVPRLDIFLERHDDQWDIVMTLTTNAGERGTWRTSPQLYPPAELDRCCGDALPGEEPFRQDIEQRFGERLVGPNRDAVLNALMKEVPLGKDVVPLNSPVPGLALAVLPLQYDQNSLLADAHFAIICQWPQHGVVVLHSTGICQPSDYTPQSKLFSGITVRHDYFELKGMAKEPVAQHQGDLGQLQLRSFLLEAPPDVPDACGGSAPLVAQP